MADATSSPSLSLSLSPFASSPLREIGTGDELELPLPCRTPEHRSRLISLSLPCAPTHERQRARCPLPRRPPPASTGEVELAFQSVWTSSGERRGAATIKLHRHWRRHARHARVKAAARARSGTQGNGGKPGLELAGAWRRRRWLCLHGWWRHRWRRHRPSAPPRRPLVVPGCCDNTASAQDGAWDKQWRRCGDPEQTFAELGEDGYDGELALAGAAPTHGGPCWGKMKKGRKSRRG
uniref:DUF834 domain-containing protein n=1 Tax=Oryza meridionalis TaxID=40149 RepID=A0A0E0D1V7_9ORYZ